MFHVSNLKKCYSDDPLIVLLEGLQVDDKLHFVEEPIEIMEHEFKQLRRSRVPIVKVQWNPRRGLEFTWEREEKFRKKYPHLFTKIAPSSSAMGSYVLLQKGEVKPLSYVRPLKVLKKYRSVGRTSQVDDKLHLVEEPVENHGREVSNIETKTCHHNCKVRRTSCGVYVYMGENVKINSGRNIHTIFSTDCSVALGPSVKP
ncbi:hypothetical protein Tco_0214829 [Tanacetum coccineum]